MPRTDNPGRTAGLWYLLLVLLGPLYLMYIPHKLFDYDNPAATVSNLLHHETLFRVGMVDELLSAFTLIFLVLALYRLFEGRLFEDIDRRLAVLVVILGGILPALLCFVNAATDATALLVAKAPSSFSAFSAPQQASLVVLFLRFHGYQNTAAESLWGAWLIPLGILTYRSRFQPLWITRALGIWLLINGAAYLTLSANGLLFPQYSGKLFSLFQPAMFAEMAFMLWLLIKGPSSGASRDADALSTGTP